MDGSCFWKGFIIFSSELSEKILSEISQKQAKIRGKTHKKGIEREERVGVLECLSIMLSWMG